MKTARFEVFKGADDQWHWHLRSKNGRIVAQGEGHTRERDARRAIGGVMRAAGAAIVKTIKG